MSKKIKFIESSNNPYKDIGFNDVKSENLKFRSQLMSLLVKYIQHTCFTQKEAAKKLNITQQKISHLMRGKIDLFSADILFEMLKRTGYQKHHHTYL
jgi:predicted XRE-type DNA-binding protein